MKKRLKIGVVGMGYWGPNLARNFNGLPDCHLKAVCDLSKETGYLQSLYPSVQAESDFNALVSDPDLDAIAIATSVKSHHPLGKASLLAGKHTFIEKPLASSIEESQELVDIAKENGLILMVGHTFLYSPPIMRIKEIVDLKRLGDIRYISARRLNLGPISERHQRRLGFAAARHLNHSSHCGRESHIRELPRQCSHYSEHRGCHNYVAPVSRGAISDHPKQLARP